MFADSKGPSEFLPVVAAYDENGWPGYTWRSTVRCVLISLSRGPSASQVASGEALADAILDIRRESKLSDGNPRMPQGLSLFFDELLEDEEASNFFDYTLPAMAKLLLRLPELLIAQAMAAADAAQQAASQSGSSSRSHCPPQLRLQILHQQRSGLIMMTQELAAAILAAAFMCVFPTAMRGHDHLPEINFDRFFACAYERGQAPEHKLRCVVHYFSRVCAQMPAGSISFERKVLPLRGPPASSNPSGSSQHGIPPTLPDPSFWATRKTRLSSFTVCDNGTIEDDGGGCLEVDFANKHLGGGVLGYGCVQEEIRFVICPELVVGMLFLPEMESNETIEIVGAERFCKYQGYGSSFRFAGDFLDLAPRDALGRRQTRIVAMDALAGAGMRQFRQPLLLREVNKAFCGLLDHASIRGYAGTSTLPSGGSNSVADGAGLRAALGSGSVAPLLQGAGQARSASPGSATGQERSGEAGGEAMEVDTVGGLVVEWGAGARAGAEYGEGGSDSGGTGAQESGGTNEHPPDCSPPPRAPGSKDGSGGGAGSGDGSGVGGTLRLAGGEPSSGATAGTKSGSGSGSDTASERGRGSVGGEDRKEGRGRDAGAGEEPGRRGEGGSQNGSEAGPGQQHSSQQNSVGVATGNWGCGAFGGDLEVKSMLQWLAASQAGRPFLLYFPFQDCRALRLREVAEWVLREGWSVGELWAMLVDYGKRRASEKVNVGLFNWLLPRPEPESPRAKRRRVLSSSQETRTAEADPEHAFEDPLTVPLGPEADVQDAAPPSGLWWGLQHQEATREGMGATTDGGAANDVLRFQEPEFNGGLRGGVEGMQGEQTEGVRALGGTVAQKGPRSLAAEGPKVPLLGWGHAANWGVVRPPPQELGASHAAHPSGADGGHEADFCGPESNTPSPHSSHGVILEEARGLGPTQQPFTWAKPQAGGSGGSNRVLPPCNLAGWEDHVHVQADPAAAPPAFPYDPPDLDALLVDEHVGGCAAVELLTPPATCGSHPTGPGSSTSPTDTGSPNLSLRQI